MVSIFTYPEFVALVTLLPELVLLALLVPSRGGNYGIWVSVLALGFLRYALGNTKASYRSLRYAGSPIRHPLSIPLLASTSVGLFLDY